jgi:phosphoenolpyruvate synthase/pyruvate phosphate dikinase
MNSNYIRFLDTISLKDTLTCGGKGASLGELVRGGIAVPNAFVLTTSITLANVQQFEKDILRSFDTLDARYVAVRSSATKEDSNDSSFAGQFDTFLNIEKKQLLAKIKQCYMSLHSDRMASYSKSQGVPLESIQIAVVVQKMVQSEVSGIGFSANPVNHKRDEIMLEAGFGLGEYVVSGIITPDKYIFDKKNGKLKEMKINYQEHKLVLMGGNNTKTQVALVKRNAQKLSMEHAKSLVTTIKKIEQKYKKPVDIEWAIEKGVVYIMQARPITTLK